MPLIYCKQYMWSCFCIEGDALLRVTREIEELCKYSTCVYSRMRGHWPLGQLGIFSPIEFLVNHDYRLKSLVKFIWRMKQGKI